MQPPKTLTLRLGAVAAILPAVFFGLWIAGTWNAPLLIDPGPVVRSVTPILKGLLQLAVAGSIGVLVFAAFALPQGSWPKLRVFAAGWTASWTASAAIHLIFNYLLVSAAEFSLGSQFGSGLWMYLTEIESGRWLAINLIVPAILTQVLLLTQSRLGTFLALLTAVLGAYPLAELGHTAAAANHSIAVSAVLLHILGISLWLGGLFALEWSQRRLELPAGVQLTRYSSLALLGFLLVGGSGISSALIRLDAIEDLLSPYGLLLLTKIGLFVLLGVLGARFRLGLGRRLANAAPEPRGIRLLLVAEGVLLATATGLGVALAAAAPPSGEQPNPDPTPAEILTGNPLPPELTPLAWATQWKPDPLWLAIILAAAIFYILGVRRLRARGDSWSTGRTASWLFGLSVLFFVTNGAPAVYGEYLFSAHMIGHMLLSMLVPVLLVLGAPVTLLARSVSSRTDDSLSVRDWVLWLLHTPFARLVSNPLFAAANFGLSLVLFYYTPLFRWANEEHLGHQWMLFHFLITGYLFAQALVGVDPNNKPVAYPFRIILLIATMAFHAFFGLGLMNESGLLLSDWYGAMGRQWGLDPLADQQAGGAIAWGIGELPTIVLTLLVVTQWARSDERERRRIDRTAARTGDEELQNYNQMLARLSQREGETRN